MSGWLGEWRLLVVATLTSELTLFCVLITFFFRKRVLHKQVEGLYGLKQSHRNNCRHHLSNANATQSLHPKRNRVERREPRRNVVSFWNSALSFFFRFNFFQGDSSADVDMALLRRVTFVCVFFSVFYVL